MYDIPFPSLKAIQDEIAQGKLTCLAVVQQYLNRIEECKSLNAFIEVYADEAIQQAKDIDKKIAEGKAGSLHGMVLSLKDTIAQKGKGLGASSKILSGFKSLFHSTATQRLLEEDCIIIGRTNCDEFAMGSSNETSFYGKVLHPHDPTKVPGGSSGGAAVSVASGCCLAALGSDTGGSIRQPASLCGLVGLKPTYGRVSRYGLIAYASSFDQIGPLTLCVDDAKEILKVISGQDDNDATSSIRDANFESAGDSNQKKTIAYPKEVLEHEGLDPEIKERFFQTLEQLKEQGHEVKPFSFPYLEFAVPTYYVLTTAEASSNLSRFDGIRYGYRSEQANDIEETYVKSRSEGFGPEVKRRIMLGTFVLSSGYYDAYYTKAQKARAIMKAKTEEVFENCDFIFLPTAPGTAFGLGEKSKDPIAMYLSDIFTVQANITGIPAISLPLAKHSNGLQYGFQLMAPAFEEGNMLRFSQQIMELSKEI